MPRSSRLSAFMLPSTCPWASSTSRHTGPVRTADDRQQPSGRPPRLSGTADQTLQWTRRPDAATVTWVRSRGRGAMTPPQSERKRACPPYSNLPCRNDNTLAPRTAPDIVTSSRTRHSHPNTAKISTLYTRQTDLGPMSSTDCDCLS